MNRYWFRPKRYGYGASPSTWEGWAATVILILAVISDLRFLPGLFRDAVSGHAVAAVTAAALVGGFVWLCRVKTDGDWRWRSGEGA